MELGLLHLFFCCLVYRERNIVQIQRLLAFGCYTEFDPCVGGIVGCPICDETIECEVSVIRRDILGTDEDTGFRGLQTIVIGEDDTGFQLYLCAVALCKKAQLKEAAAFDVDVLGKDSTVKETGREIAGVDIALVVIGLYQIIIVDVPACGYPLGIEGFHAAVDCHFPTGNAVAGANASSTCCPGCPSSTGSTRSPGRDTLLYTTERNLEISMFNQKRKI